MAAVVAELDRQLAGARAQLDACRSGFASLAAFYGEQASAMANEQELWGGVQAFVERFSAAQRAVEKEAREEAERIRRQRGSSSSSKSSTPARGSVQRGGPAAAAAATPPGAGAHAGSGEAAKPVAGQVGAAPAVSGGGRAGAPPPPGAQLANGTASEPQADRVPAQMCQVAGASTARQLDFPSPARQEAHLT